MQFCFTFVFIIISLHFGILNYPQVQVERITFAIWFILNAMQPFIIVRLFNIIILPTTIYTHRVLHGKQRWKHFSLWCQCALILSGRKHSLTKTSETDASSIKAVQEMWIRPSEEPGNPSVCTWAGSCKRADGLHSPVHAEGALQAKVKRGKWEVEESSLKSQISSWVPSVPPSQSWVYTPPNHCGSNLWDLPGVDYHSTTYLHPQHWCLQN